MYYDRMHLGQLDELFSGFHRAYRVYAAKRKISKVGPCGTVLGSRKLEEHEPESQFSRELTFWYGIFGFSTKSGGGHGIMSHSNRGCADAARVVRKAMDLVKQGAKLVYDDVMALIDEAGPWKHRDEIVALALLGRLPHPAAAVLSQVQGRRNVVAIGVPLKFLKEEKKEPPNEHIGLELEQFEFNDRHEVLWYRAEFFVFMSRGRLGTKHEWVELLNLLKHRRLRHARAPLPHPPVYLVEEVEEEVEHAEHPCGRTNGGPHRWWREAIDFLGGSSYISPSDFLPVKIVGFKDLVSVLEDTLYWYIVRHSDQARLLGSRPQQCVPAINGGV